MPEILQLSDLHVMADPHARLKGVCTRETLAAVLRHVNAGVAAGKWNFDAVVITGDFTHDETPAAYEAVKELLSDWLPRCRIIPGNHDDRSVLRSVFGEQAPRAGEFINFSCETASPETDAWRLIGLDTHVPGKLYGELPTSQLEWFAKELETHAAEPTLLFMHHPPTPIGSPWIDDIGLREPAAFLNLIGQHSQVRIVATGHVHQEFTTSLGGATLFCTPSTGVQFLPQQETLVCDTAPPGFRVFRLDGNAFETEVVRLPQ